MPSKLFPGLPWCLTSKEFAHQWSRQGTDNSWSGKFPYAVELLTPWATIIQPTINKQKKKKKNFVVQDAPSSKRHVTFTLISKVFYFLIFAWFLFLFSLHVNKAHTFNLGTKDNIGKYHIVHIEIGHRFYRARIYNCSAMDKVWRE